MGGGAIQCPGMMEYLFSTIEDAQKRTQKGNCDLLRNSTIISFLSVPRAWIMGVQWKELPSGGGGGREGHECRHEQPTPNPSKGKDEGRKRRGQEGG